MTEPEDNSISRLIALKRFERMPEGFENELVHRLHQAQRAELMNQSLRSVIMERLELFWESLAGPQLAAVSVTALALLLGAIWMVGFRSSANNSTTASAPVLLSDQPLPPGFEMQPPDLASSGAVFGTTLPPDQAAKLTPVLLSKHFDGGFSSDVRDAQLQDYVQPHQPGAFKVIPSINFGFGAEPDEPAAK